MIPFRNSILVLAILAALWGGTPALAGDIVGRGDFTFFLDTAAFRAADDRILEYVTDFLQRAHAADETYTSRDGVNVTRYALKLLAEDQAAGDDAVRLSITRILGDDALRHLE